MSKALVLLAVAVALAVPAVAQPATTMAWQSPACFTALEQIGTCMKDVPEPEGEGHPCCVTMGDVIAACGGPLDIVRALDPSVSMLPPEILNPAAGSLMRCNLHGATESDCVAAASVFAECTTSAMMSGVTIDTLTPASPCCEPHFAAFSACSSYDIDSAIIPALDTMEKKEFFDNYHEACPNFAPEFCVAGAESLKGCLINNGLMGDFDLASNPTTPSCCGVAAATNSFCDNLEVRDLVPLTDAEYNRGSELMSICVPDDHMDGDMGDHPSCHKAIDDMYYQASTGRVLTTRCEGEACMAPVFEYNGVRYYQRFDHLPMGMVPNYDCLRAPMPPPPM